MRWRGKALYIYMNEDEYKPPQLTPHQAIQLLKKHLDEAADVLDYILDHHPDIGRVDSWHLKLASILTRSLEKDPVSYTHLTLPTILRV